MHLKQLPLVRAQLKCELCEGCYAFDLRHEYDLCGSLLHPRKGRQVQTYLVLLLVMLALAGFLTYGLCVTGTRLLQSSVLLLIALTIIAVLTAGILHGILHEIRRSRIEFVN